MKIKIDILKPRNPLVVLVKFRKSGKHGKTTKQKRGKWKQEILVDS